MRVKLSKIYEELEFLNDPMSTQVRAVALGLVGLAWVLLVGGDNVLKIPVTARLHILISALLALGAMAVDFLHYFIGYIYADSLRKQLEKERLADGQYTMPMDSTL